ncbi:MAG: DUF523 domain-containing protein [Pseudomonadales bacterium]|nr:DUF523 domain-containing protein [Pseudomonadales bacterium]
MYKILVSACLLGDKVRYDGASKGIDHPLWSQWKSQGRLLAICPEVSGGLPVPRPAAEIIGSDVTESGRAVLQGKASILTKRGADVSEQFIQGAEAALALARKNDIRLAIMVEGSPSCGSHLVHDGTFSNALLAGEGVSTALLRQHGIQVFSHKELELAEVYLAELE